MLSVRSPITEKMPTAQPNAMHGAGGNPKRTAPARGDQRDGAEAAERALPRLAGTHARRQFSPAEFAPGEERADVRRKHQQQQPQNELRAAHAAVVRGLQPRERDERRHQHRDAAQQREPRLVPLRCEHQPEEGDAPPDARSGEQRQQMRGDRRSRASDNSSRSAIRQA